MPYIPRGDRRKLDPFIDGASRNTDTVGELTYALYRLCKGFLSHGPESFASYAAVVAALECTKLEMYRAEVSKYEDGKRVANGPVLVPVSQDASVSGCPCVLCKPPPRAAAPDCHCAHPGDCDNDPGCQRHSDWDGPEEFAREGRYW